MIDPKERFSDRVQDYVRHRPAYPEALRTLFVDVCSLGPGRVVADLGSGTGLLSRLLLSTGARVLGVEPNQAMRAAAESAFAGEPRFESVNGSAEATGLAAASVDVVAAGQAFHWFDPMRARAEALRVLRPEGWVVLVWNRRKSSPLGRAYEDMLERYAPDYAHVRERDRAAEPNLRAFFAPGVPVAVRLDNEQTFDEQGLRGRLMSSSYAPRPGHPLHEPMMRRLTEIFRESAKGGTVTLAYDTEVWYGQLQ